MKALIRWSLFLLLIAGAAGWFLSRPDPLPEAELAGLTGDAEAGALVFAAAGCASCHAAAEAAPSEGDAAGNGPVLAGGTRLASDFGTFVAPNISPDPEHGIGNWTDAQIINATMRGVSPGGAHYYPAFPHTAYRLAEPQDIADMVAYLRTLPADATPSQPHELNFPFTIRRGVGLWMQLYATDDWTLTGDLSPEVERGRYLVEALGHCAECHTPRDALGGLDRAAWMQGAPNPSGDGRIPPIDPANLTWTEQQIAEYLNSGFTPEFDTAGGSMAAVIRNTSLLPEEDRSAIAAYLKALE